MPMIMISTAYHAYVHAFEAPSETAACPANEVTVANAACDQGQVRATLPRFSAWLAALARQWAEARAC